MKKIIMFFITTFCTLICMVQAELTNEEKILLQNQMTLNDAIWLSTEINMPTTSVSRVWTESFVSEVGTIHTNDFIIIFNNIPEMEFTDLLVHSNKLIIASGILYERSTFDDARTALILKLIENSMPVSVLALNYNLQTNGIGDFNVVRTTKNENEERINRRDWICFIRGAKAVYLRGIDGADVQFVAEVLDALLKNPPASQ